jgi:hypothetical protein
MVKRASTFGLCKVFAVAVVVCLIGLALAHSSLAQVVIPEKLSSEPGQFMALSADKTHLINTFTNKPVFITGEAAWSLIAEPSDADVETYLADRAARGFNGIIVNLIEHQYADHAPADFYGDAPFSGASFSTPNEAYFAHADHVISRAAAHGITVFLFPVYLGYGSGQCNIKNEG